MQKSYESGLATHIGLESCGAAREGGVEALTGDVRPGIQPRKKIVPGRRRCRATGNGHGVAADDTEKVADEAE